ncbi:MAG: hypothetical protein NVS1B9_15390 [Solirubrobacteraceae bacterium]
MSRPPRGETMHDGITRLLSVAMIAIGVALLTRLTVLSIVLGLLFLAAGCGRLFVQLRLRGRSR